jgi:hypothetical protein
MRLKAAHLPDGRFSQATSAFQRFVAAENRAYPTGENLKADAALA